VWWVWFVVGFVAFLVLYVLIFGPLAEKAKEKVREGEEMRKSGDPVERYLGVLHSGEGRWFVPMAGLLASVWLVYPVNFFLDEQGIGVYSHPVGDAVYTVADVTAKVVYGFILLGGVLAIERRAAGAMGRSPKQMGDGERMRFEAELERHEGDAARHSPCRSVRPPGTGPRRGMGPGWPAPGAATIRCAFVGRIRQRQRVDKRSYRMGEGRRIISIRKHGAVDARGVGAARHGRQGAALPAAARDRRRRSVDLDRPHEQEALNARGLRPPTPGPILGETFRP
jgi:hypothetical protein